MQMNGEELINAPRDVVWAGLNDPDILRQSIPGCQTVDKESDTAFTATVKVKIGPVSANFKGKVTLSNVDAPNGYTISGEGKGGAAGFGKGSADISLTEAPGGTLLSYSVEASVGGKMAQIGSRLIDGTAKKLAGEFFTNFNRLISEDTDGQPAPSEPAPVAEPFVEAANPVRESPATAEIPAPAETPPSPGWMRPSILIPMGIVAALILYYFARR